MNGVAPLRSVVEWIVAAAVLVAVGWFASGYALRWIERRSEPAVEAVAGVPTGVPTGATSVPLLMLLDGREVRTGLTHAELQMVIGSRSAVGEPHRSDGAFGERVTQAYQDRGTLFFITTERTENGGPIRVTGIFLP